MYVLSILLFYLLFICIYIFIYLFNFFFRLDENKIIETKTETQNDIKNKIYVIENDLQAIADSKNEYDGVLKSLTQ